METEMMTQAMPRYRVRIENDGGETILDAEDLDHACELAHEWVGEGDYNFEAGQGTIWVRSQVTSERDLEDARTLTTRIDPPEPKCTGRRWQVQISIDQWAGAAVDGRWVPGIAGTYNQTDLDDAAASTFASEGEAEREAEDLRAYVRQEQAEREHDGGHYGEWEVRVEAIDIELPHDHDWQSPHALVGGLKENPGVRGHGGGVVIHEVCVHCGTLRVTDTWAQNPSTGEEGLESVRYEAGKYADEVAAGLE
jgi:hypothetical protein